MNSLLGCNKYYLFSQCDEKSLEGFDIWFLFLKDYSKEPASERGVCAQLQCASEPAGRPPDTPTEDRQRPEAALPQPGV